MFSHSFYNVVHIVGLILLLAGLGGIATMSRVPQRDPAIRRVHLAFHGLGTFLILLGGFGMLARLGIVHGTAWPAWVWAKVGIWAVLGAGAFLPFRFPRTALPIMVLSPVLGGLAAYMAIYKPF